MIVANFSEFRANLKKYLDSVEDDKETLIIKRKTGNGTVLISIEAYNSLMDTVEELKAAKVAAKTKKSVKPASAAKANQSTLEF